jgi:hypothetical protein
MSSLAGKKSGSLPAPARSLVVVLGGRLEPRVGPWHLPLPAGAEDCHDWEKMQSSAAQRPGSAAAVLTKEHSQPHAQAVGWNPVLGHGIYRRCRCRRLP